MCNSEHNCGDGSDETGCGNYCFFSAVLKAYCNILHTLHYLIGNCSGSSFHCASGECVLQERVCNSIIDCADGSDEFGCGKIQLQEQW